VVTTAADYSELGWLLITVALIGLVVPLLTIYIVQRSRFRTLQ
jgi:formate-dependent nitrite reductase membrane component NrfD